MQGSTEGCRRDFLMNERSEAAAAVRLSVTTFEAVRGYGRALIHSFGNEVYRSGEFYQWELPIDFSGGR